MKVLLYAYFYNTSLNELGPTYFSIYNLLFSHFPEYWENKGQSFMSSCTNRFAVFIYLFGLTCIANPGIIETAPTIFFFLNIF